MDESTGTEATEPGIWHGAVDASGRLTIPAELREELNVEAGTALVITRTDDGLSVMTYEENIRRIQAIYKAASPSDDVWSEDLMAERRREAAREQHRS